MDDTSRPTATAVGSPWLFFAATYAVTWGFWLTAVALGVRFDSAAGLVLLLLGLTGPGVAGVGFAYLVYGERGLTDLWDRLTQVRRIGVTWGLVVLSVPVVVTAAATAVGVLTGGRARRWATGYGRSASTRSRSCRRCSSQRSRPSSRNSGGVATRWTGSNSAGRP